ncbi:hypothetical protein LZG75_08760 [Polynucleobacter sp. IMCC30063]|uniref:hypothetical protein n=1 Tax=unclassified Polynucleobacter TaxID=2640945 RepID=UPI001F36CA7A|nr:MULTISPECIES: hypothetical protein [unclassified Polynucleobacter]MCE7506330.1 hypothetical protein [Polynucleobacter sp. IMCC30063]MCE7527610.1 hypothetical protein [Polynucleobacter sp. IMCC 30228]
MNKVAPKMKSPSQSLTKSTLKVMPNWQRHLSYPSFCICMGSGLLYLLIQEWATELSFVANRWVLILHGVSAMAVTIIFGAALPLHIRLGLHLNKNILSGLGFTTVLMVLMISGQLLYYGSGDTREWVITAHWLIGVLSILIAYCHIVKRSGSKCSVALKRGDDLQG